MHKKNKKQLILLLLLTLIVYACDRIGDFSFDDEQSSLLEDMQKWYRVNKANTSEVHFLEEAPVLTIKPEWEHSAISRNDEYIIFETPILADKYFGIIDLECEQKYNETNDKRYMGSRSILVMRKKLENNEIDGFIMTITPNLSYFQSTNFRAFRNNTYLNRDKNLEGYIFYHDLDGNFVNGWQYVNGLPYMIDIPKKNSETGNFRSIECFQYVSYTYTEWTQGGNYTGSISEGTFDVTITNTSHIVNVYSYYCVNGSSGNGNYAPPTTGGNSSTGNGNGSYYGNLSPAAKSIIDNCYLDNEGVNLLKDAIDDAINNCGYDFMYKHVINKNFSFSSVKYDPSGTYGGYDPDDKTLYFKNNSSIASSFMHEFIHLYQDAFYQGGISQYKYNGKPNIEYEARVMMDIICFITTGLCTEYGSFNFDSNNSSNYIKWIHKITDGSTKVPSLDDIMANCKECGDKNYDYFLNYYNMLNYNPYYSVTDLQPNALVNLKEALCFNDKKK